MSNTKVIVVPSDDMKKPADVFAKAVADKLGVCPEDVIVLSGVSSIAFAAVPAELVEAKKKADAEVKAKADAEAKGLADAEAKAVADAAKAAKQEKAADKKAA